MAWSADSIRPLQPLEAGQLHVWRMHLVQPEAALGELATLLSSEEREKAARFRFEHDRARHVTAHAGLRWILAGYLGCPPASVEMEAGPWGKPLLSGTGRTKGLSFNLSHSGEWGLLAIGRQQYIGVDIERHRDLADLDELAESVLTPAEMEILQACPGETRTRCFFQMWTRKEAVVKATGAGIGSAFSEIEIEPADPAEADEFAVTGLEEVPVLFGKTFEPAPGYSAAVVCEQDRVQIGQSDWPSQ